MHRHKTRCPNVIVRTLNAEDASEAGLMSWSLQPLQTQDDVLKNRGLVSGLSTAFRRTSVRKVFAPSVVSMNAVVIDSKQLSNCIQLYANIFLYRGRDVPADGVFLRPGEAFVVSAAGCAVIVATAGEHMVVAHAGRDSLIDRDAVMGTPSRKHISIVHAIVEAFGTKGIPAHEITMFMLFSIPREAFEHRFDHCEYGRYNRRLAEFIGNRWNDCLSHSTDNDAVFVDLQSIFKKQALEAGVLAENAWTEHSLDLYPKMAHTRDGKNPKRRNLIWVIHKPKRFKTLLALSSGRTTIDRRLPQSTPVR